MSGVDLVMAALAAGASAGLTDTASSAVRDGYAGLREAVRRRLAAGGGDGARVLDAREVEPGVWEARLRERLAATGADQDAEILVAARLLLRDLGVAGANVVDARDAKGVQIGDNNTQTNTFN
ncbi:hypothetical protein ACQFX6_37815 [Streptomyces sp. DSM 41987]|uniref:hypothetical protein n=1 Tax=Streptomyces TaxID=1883 RepID=UPI0018DF1631|nr:hypothetical protein [Streptomyces fildesensis]